MKKYFACLFFVLQLISQLAYAQKKISMGLPLGHTSSATSAFFSADNKQVITGGLDNTIGIWDVATGNLVKLLGSGGGSFNVSFSYDGRFGLTRTTEGYCEIWDILNFKLIAVIPTQCHGVFSCKFSRDGYFLITSYGEVWNFLNGKKVCDFNLKYEFSVEGSNKNKFLLVLPEIGSNEKSPRIFDFNTGQLIDSFKFISYRNNSEDFYSFCFSADDKLLFLGEGYDNGKVWDMESHTVKFELILSPDSDDIVPFHVADYSSAVFSPDSKYLVTGNFNGEIRTWDVNSGQCINVFNVDTGTLESIKFSLDSKKLLITNFNGSTFIVDFITGLKISTFIGGHNKSVYSASLSSDNKYVVTASDDNSAVIWDLNSGKIHKKLIGYSKNIGDSFLSNNGSIVISSDHHFSTLWDFKSGEILKNFYDSVRTKRFFSSNNEFMILCDYKESKTTIYNLIENHENEKLIIDNTYFLYPMISSDGKYVISGNYDSLFVYSLTSSKLKKVFITTDFYGPLLKFSPDNNFLITTHSEGTRSIVKVWSLSSGDSIAAFLNEDWFNGVTDVKISYDNSKIIIAYDSDYVKVYNLKNGELINKVQLPQVRSFIFDVKAIQLCPDNKNILIGGQHGIVYKWDIYTNELKEIFRDWSSDFWFDPIKNVHKIKYNDKILADINFSDDGKFVITTTTDYKIIIYDANTGKKLYTRLLLEGNDWLVYDDDYRFDGTPGAIDKLYFVCGLEVVDLAQLKDSLWVPGLAEKIMNNQDILINNKPAPKLSTLNICDLTPLIEPIKQLDEKQLKYRITPRNGGLGNTEVYINGNLTYTFKPEQLQKKKEGKQEIYYLSIATDTLQNYLSGEKNSTNPIEVKSKVKQSGIYSRGVKMEISKTIDNTTPKFFGVFIGVNDYGNPNKEVSETKYRDLTYAKKDADDLASAVEKTARNLFKDSCSIYRLTGEGVNAPTKENIQRVFDEIGAKANASDVLYVFFAGHGDIKKADNELGQQEEEIRFMTMQADKINFKNTSFGVKELTEWCSPKHIKAQKRVFVFDACHSGKIINQTMAFASRGDEDVRIRQLDKLKDKNGMMILAAAAANESAYEDETLDQGVLTYHLLEVMKEHKDTLLQVRDWFDETIKLVNEYSVANGNKQEPSSFGDGRFEVGNIKENVRESIAIKCPKTRVGLCSLSDPNGDAEKVYPKLEARINQYFAGGGSRGNLVFSKRSDIAYSVKGTYASTEKGLLIRYRILKGDAQIGNTITLSPMKGKSEDEVVLQITSSIIEEIELVDKTSERCKLSLIKK